MVPIPTTGLAVGTGVALGTTGVAVSWIITAVALGTMVGMEVGETASTSGVGLCCSEVAVARADECLGVGLAVGAAADRLNAGILQLINRNAVVIKDMKMDKDLDCEIGCLGVMDYSSLRIHPVPIWLISKWSFR
jgi:hypothetical protein